VLHPLDKDYSYKQIPTDAADEYNLVALERRAASYYERLRTAPETWKSIQDLEPQLVEFEHRVRAHDYDGAARLIDEIDREYLVPWGHSRRVMNMREQLLGKIADRELEERNLGLLGLAYHTMGKVEQAANYYRQALVIAREIGDRQGEATRLGHLGIAYSNLGQIEQAIEHYEQALAIARELGDRRGVGRHLGNLGLAYQDLGQVEKAVDIYQQALAIAREIGNRQGEGHQLGNLGNAYRVLGQIERAIETYKQALPIARDLNDRAMEEIILGNLGESYYDLGETAQAVSTGKEALSIARDIDDSRSEGYWLNNLAKAYRSSGDFDQAVQYLQEAIAIATEIHEPSMENHAKANLARMYLHQGRFLDAEKTIVEARKIDVVENNHVTAVLHGLILARLDRREAACTALSQALNYAEEYLGKTPGYYVAKYTQALALSGLALLADNGDQALLIGKAQTAYQDALANCSARGVVGDAVKLLDELRPLDTATMLSPIRGLLTG
jgi:tetratricopeptide (TPR) repeat protein